MEREEESVIDLVRLEFDKLNRRFDAIENKVSDIHATHERIKKEAAFKRQYTETPLYGAKHLSLVDYDQIEEDSDRLDDKKMIICCTIQ